MDSFIVKDNGNGDTAVGNGFVDTVGEGESGTNGDGSTNIYTLCV